MNNLLEIPLIELRITGDNVVPGSVKSRDLADVLISVEDMIASVVEQNNPRVQKDEITVGLVNVREGSIRLQFTSPLPNLVFPAYFEIANSVKSNDYSNLPSSSLKSLEKIAAFARKRHCDLEFRTQNGKAEVLAVITPSTLIEEVPVVIGTTTIYGQVLRIGGRKPKVFVELLTGRGINCEISGTAEEQRKLAQTLAPHIYMRVGLQGIAKWSSKDYTVREFRVTQLTDYEATPISSAMGELSRLIGRYFDDIEDVDQYVSELRSDGVRS